MSIASCDLGHDALQRALYSPKEVQRILGISRATVYRLLAARRLDARKLNGKTVITADSIGQLISDLPPAQVRPT
jgi:excisionase family DNA binding protein